MVYALGLFLLGAAFLIAAHAQELWQFQLSVGLCVGLGIALIGNVPNSILLGRWFGPRLPTAMAIVYSATGAGILVLLPASQLLIDRIGWRDAYQLFGIVALCLLLPLLVLPWRLFATGSPHIAGKTDAGFVDNGWTLGSAMRHHAFWALFCTFFFTAVAMYAITAQIVAYLIDAGFPPLQAATAWGFSGVRDAVRHARHLHARRHHRPPALGAVQLRHLDRRHHSAVADSILSELLAADGIRHLLRQHDRFARAADHRDRAQHLSAASGSAPFSARSRSAAGSARDWVPGPAA